MNRGAGAASFLKSPRYHFLFRVVLLTWAASTVRADVVETTDGSRFVGKVNRLVDGRITITTSVAGRIEIPTDMIVAIVTDETMNVAVSSGDRLVGTVGKAEAPNRAVVQSKLGTIEVSTGDITGMWVPGDDSPEVIAIKTETEKKLKAVTPVWTIRIDAGGSRTEGNTDTLTGRGRFDVLRTTEADRLNFYLAGEYSEQNNARNRNEYYGGVKYENQITQRLYWYTRTELEYDEFENIDLRATAAAGIGYFWIKEEPHEFKTRAGLGYRHEAYRNGDTQDDAILDLGIDYRLDIAPWVQFVHSDTYSPAWDDFDDYRLVADTALLFPLKSELLKLKLGMRNEYNSRPARGRDRLDNTYYANLLFELKP